MNNVDNNNSSILNESPNKQTLSKKKLIFILIILFCAIVLIGLLSFKYMEYSKYNKAKLLLQEGEILEAKAMFLELKEYKDTEDIIKSIDYNLAIEQYENGKYEEAKIVFNKLMAEKYMESEKYTNKCDYKLAINNYKSKKYDEAKKVFSDLALNKFEDSVEYIKKCDYQIAIVTFKNNDLKKAEKMFNDLHGYEESNSYIDKILMIEKYQTCNIKNEDEIKNIELNLSNYYGMWYNLNDGTEYKVDKYYRNGRKYGITEYGGDAYDTAFYYLDDNLKKIYHEKYSEYLPGFPVKTISTSDNSEYYEYVKIPAEEYKVLYDEYIKEQKRLLEESKSKYKIESVYEIAQSDAYLKIGTSDADNFMDSLTESFGNLLFNVSIYNFTFQDINNITYDYDSNNKVHTLLFEVYSNIYGEIDNTFFVEAQYKESDSGLDLIYFYYY